MKNAQNHMPKLLTLQQNAYAYIDSVKLRKRMAVLR